MTERVRTAPVIVTAHLFRPLGRELLSLLRSFRAEQWTRGTSAGEWSVKDVAAHLLDVDLRRLSSQRDGYVPPPARPIASTKELVAYLNELNRTWVEAARRLSPDVLMDELDAASARVAELFERSDPMQAATFPVAWAGEESSRMWLDIAREYTERWHHQDQIREAVGAAPLADSLWLRPVLETSLLALVPAYRGVDAPTGAAVLLRITGSAGGEWTLVKDGAWRLESGRAGKPACVITASDLNACRLLLHRLGADATDAIRVEGDAALAEPFINARAVMV